MAEAPGTSVRLGSAVGSERITRADCRGALASPRASISRRPGGSAAGRRAPCVPRPGRVARAARVDEHVHDLHPGDPVGQGVVELVEQSDPALLEAVDQMELPQRPRAVERRGDDAGDVVGHGARVAGGLDAALPDVEGDVEVGVLDPVGMIEPERDLGQLPGIGRHEMDSLRHRPAHVLSGGGGTRALADHEEPGVAVAAGLVQGQKLRVQAAELLHPSVTRATRPATVSLGPAGYSGRALAFTYRSHPGARIASATA